MSFVADPVEYSGEARTKQSMREECDINAIVAKARKGQAVSHLAKREPSYGDFSDVGDYKTALDRLRAADKYFLQLPARVRREFNNDPAEYLDALESGEGRERLERAGLVPPMPVVVPVPAVPGGVTPPA